MPQADWTEITDGSVTLRARTVGQGRPILMIPSAARGPADFDPLAQDLAGHGRMTLLYEPRWFGGSDGPERISLFDLADDAARVIEHFCPGQAVDVAGHAFGNRVARTLATRHPDRVAALILLASGGQAPIPPNVGLAVQRSTQQGLIPDSERLKDLRLAFFAPGHDPAQWLEGWSPRAAGLQSAAIAATPPSEWQGGGQARILVIQPALDPVAPRANALALQAMAPDRVRILDLPNASHAMLPEQPAALAAVIAAYLAGERDEVRLQALIDRAVVD